MNLRQKLVYSYVLIALVATLLASTVGAFLLRTQQRDSAGDALRVLAQNAATRYETAANTSNDTSQALSRFAEQEGLRVLAVDQRGSVVYDSEGRLRGESFASEIRHMRTAVPAESQPAQPVVRLHQGGEDLLVTPLPVPEQLRRTDAGDAAFVLLAVPTGSLQGSWLDMLPVLLGAVIVVLLIAMALAFYFSRRLSEPLIHVKEAAAQIAGGKYDTRIDIEDDDDEIGEVVNAFNTMAAEVTAARQAQRDLMTNIGHDLRTPLTSIQGFSQALLDGTADTEDERERVAQIIHEETSRLSRLIQQMLDLARIEAGTLSMAQEEADLSDVLDHLEYRYKPIAEARDIHFAVNRPRKSLPIKGDPNRLEQALTSLLDNAFEHAGSNGRQGEVRLAGKLGGVRGANGGDSAGGLLGRWWIELEVADNGRSFEGDDLPHVFERFPQAHEVRGGSGAGLGLAIAREIVNAHGGDISVESDEEGTTFEVRLPMNMGF